MVVDIGNINGVIKEVDMRQIKFRAWDKEEKCFYKRDCRAFEGVLDDMVIDFKGNLFKRNLNSSVLSGTWDNKGENRYILMQYTGLKDKNGKEIYEGDILHYDSDDDNEVVEWQHILCHECGNGFGMGWNLCETQESVIIGNIYENEGLLKNKP